MRKSQASCLSLPGAGIAYDETPGAGTFKPQRQTKSKILEITKEKKKITKKTEHLGSLHDRLQSLDIGGEARKADEDTIVDLGDPLEISGDCL